MADAPGGVGEPAELAGITLCHNQVRAMVDTTHRRRPAAVDAVGSGPRRARREAWVVAVHATPTATVSSITLAQSRTNAAGYAYVGENIYALRRHGDRAGRGGPVGRREGELHVPDDGAHGTCGHYTQIVWRDSLHVGCALDDCPGLQFRRRSSATTVPAETAAAQAPY